MKPSNPTLNATTSHRASHHPPAWMHWAGAAFWLMLSILGFLGLAQYAAVAGPAAAPLQSWPHDSQLQRDPVRPTLVLFFHPHCPCSQATMQELPDLLSRHHSACRTIIVLSQPAEASADWSDTALAAQARAVPGAQVVVDQGEVETSRFGAVTSGTAMLFDATGALRFMGGLTASRGHVGPSKGAEILTRLLVSHPSADSQPESTPVYGCALQTSTQASTINETSADAPVAGAPACCKKP